MKPLLPLVTFLFLVTSVVPAVAQPETLNLKLGLDWVAVHRVETRGHISIDYHRQGDDATHPKERFGYENGALHGHRTPEEDLDTLKADTEKRCPGATTWNVISVDEGSVLYESQSKACGDSAASHVIAKILHGKHNFFALIYVYAGEDLDPDTRTKWIGTLQDAHVEGYDGGPKPVGSEDIDSVIPFETDKVMAALKSAMASVSCDVKDDNPLRVECKRPRNSNGKEGGYGGESVTAVLEAQDAKTHVRISTGKGFYGRLGKQNWSMAVYERMMRNLEQAKP